MAYLSKTKALFKLDNSLIDVISSVSLESVNGSSISYVPGGLGVALDRKQYFVLESATLSISDKATIGFWLTPKNSGVYSSDGGKTLQPIKQAVLDLSQGALNGSEYVSTEDIIVLTEETQSNMVSNRMRIRIFTSGSEVYNGLTPTYDVDKRHLFWIVYDGASPSLSVYIDGINQSLSSSGVVPSTINASTASISVNRNTLSGEDTCGNNAVLDDLFITNTAESNQDDIQKVVNESVDRFLEQFTSDYVELDFVVLYDDPVAAKVTDAAFDGTYVFAARSDGKLLKGSPLVWQKRIDFNNFKEYGVLDVFGDISLPSSESDNTGFLKVTKGVFKV